MRVLAADIGTIRLGFAVTDPLQISAQPLPTRAGGSARQMCKTIIAVLQDFEAAGQENARVETVVIGNPIHMNGSASPMSELAGECVRLLTQYIRQNVKREIPVVLWNERLTSVAAERIMLEGGARRAERKKKKDQIAAQLILQGYLDAQKHTKK